MLSCLQLPLEGQLQSLLSVASDRTQGNSWRGLGWILGEGSFSQRVVRHQAGSSGNGHGPTAARSSRSVWTTGRGWNCWGACAGQELEWLILMDPFPLRIFYGSVKSCLTPTLVVREISFGGFPWEGLALWITLTHSAPGSGVGGSQQGKPEEYFARACERECVWNYS